MLLMAEHLYFLAIDLSFLNYLTKQVIEEIKATSIKL